MKKLFSLLMAVSGAVALSACDEVQGQVEAPARPVKVQAAQPVPGAPVLRYSATIQADREVPLAFKVSGYVAAIPQRRGADGRSRPLQPGDAVRAGEVLARVRDADYRERVNQAAGSVGELEAAQNKARLDLERAKTLFASESLTKPDLDAAQAAFDANVARIAAAHAQVELAEIALRDAALVAPISGVVLERKIEVGTLVSAGAVGFVIGQVAPVKAVIGVPDMHVARIALGHPLPVSSDGAPGATFQGIVTAIAPAADNQSRLFSVEVSLPNRDGALRPGMIGAVAIPAGRDMPSEAQPAGAAIPLAAVVRSDAAPDGYAVFVVEGDGEKRIARARQVELGDVRGNSVAVTRGLEKGESVVVSGPGLLTDGERVRIIP